MSVLLDCPVIETEVVVYTFPPGDSWSNVVETTTAPARPTNVSRVILGPTSVRITFQDETGGEAWHRLYFREVGSADPWEMGAELAPEDLEGEIHGLSLGTTNYEFSATAFIGELESGFAVPAGIGLVSAPVLETRVTTYPVEVIASPVTRIEFPVVNTRVAVYPATVNAHLLVNIQAPVMLTVVQVYTPTIVGTSPVDQPPMRVLDVKAPPHIRIAE